MKPLMKRAATGILSIFAVGAMTMAGFSGIDRVQGTQGPPIMGLQALTASWPAASLLTANLMIDKYGPPDSATNEALTWRHRGDFERIEVYRDEDPVRRSGILEHVVRYDVPVGSWRDLYMLVLGVNYEPIGQMLSAASASEQANILALNVADDVIKDRRDVWQARAFYLKTMELARAGKSSDYTRGLRFKPMREDKHAQPGQIWPLP